jgi:hypothetical protein
MIKIPDSGFYYPSSFVRNLLMSLEEVAGKNGVKAILNLAGQSSMIDNYPPDDMNSGIDIARYSMIIATLDDLYGDRGAQVLALKAGNMLFAETMKKLEHPLDVTSDAHKAKSIEEKVESGLMFIHSVVIKTPITSMPRTPDGQLVYSVPKCPVCYGRETKNPRCFLTVGLLQAMNRYTTGDLEFTVTQTKAHSCGDSCCEYVVSTIPNT